MSREDGANGRLGREEWLARALDILALEGQATLRIDRLCTALGVTKGSFYWHFEDRDDFVRSLVAFWSDNFTDPVLRRITRMEGSPRDRLKALMHTVSEGGLARYDVSIRAWAAQDPELLASTVKAVDRRRLAFTWALFEEMGFDKENAEMRARLRRLSQLRGGGPCQEQQAGAAKVTRWIFRVDYASGAPRGLNGSC